MSRQAIFSQIDAERDHQNELWGATFDDRNTVNDWGTWINNYLTRATTMTSAANFAEQRKSLVKVAALAVAAIETMDRNNGFPPRHFEQPAKAE